MLPKLLYLHNFYTLGTEIVRDTAEILLDLEEQGTCTQ